MIHIGELAYYHEINKRLANCDLVLFEGKPWGQFSYFNIFSMENLGVVACILITPLA